MNPPWKPVWAVLEDDFELLLVNARHVKNLPGRKTDLKDAEWLCQLLEAGLLRASFVPPKPIRELRQLTRYRKAQISLQREAPRLVERARNAQVHISFIGMHPSFDETRYYRGDETEWVLAPVRANDVAVVPPAEARALRALTEAGIHFPLTYVAHELEPGRLALPPAGSGAGATEAAAIEAVGEVPPPAETVKLTERLGRMSRQITTVLARALPVAASGALVVPAALGAVALEAAAAGSLDPIIFGVLPAGRPVIGQPAAWFIVASWRW